MLENNVKHCSSQRSLRSEYECGIGKYGALLNANVDIAWVKCRQFILEAGTIHTYHYNLRS